MRRDPAHAVAAAPPAPHVPMGSVDLVVDEVGRRLHGEIDAGCIRQTIEALIRAEFADARVTVYVPILLARRACEVLRTRLATPARLK